MSGVGAQIVVRELRKLYGSVEVSNDDEAVDITTTAWWKKMEATSHPGTVLWTYRDNAGPTLQVGTGGQTAVLRYIRDRGSFAQVAETVSVLGQLGANSEPLLRLAVSRLHLAP